MILKKALNSTDDAILALGHYHSWHDEKAKQYELRVFSVLDVISQLRIDDKARTGGQET